MRTLSHVRFLFYKFVLLMTGPMQIAGRHRCDVIDVMKFCAVDNFTHLNDKDFN